MKNADMPAMPIVDTDAGYPLDVSRYGDGLSNGKFASGLTKREMMAMHMMHGLLSANATYGGRTDARDLMASDAVEHADALLSALDRTSK